MRIFLKFDDNFFSCHESSFLNDNGFWKKTSKIFVNYCCWKIHEKGSTTIMRQYKVTFKVKSFVISPVFLMISSRIFLTCISPVVFSQWCQKFIKLNFSYYLLSYVGIISFLPHFVPDSFGPRLLSEPRQSRLLILGINILLFIFGFSSY